MRKSPTKIADVREDGFNPIEVEVDERFIDFYKKETGRKRVTRKGLSDFINNLLTVYHR